MKWKVSMGRLNTLEERQAEMRERHTTVEPLPPPMMAYGERHYSVTDIASLWGLSRDSVRRLFRREPGVLAIGERYVTLRIPASVLERVHRRLSNGEETHKPHPFMSRQR